MLITNQLVERSFLRFQDKSRKKSCLETADPFAQSHSLARWWGLVSNVRCQFLWIPVIPEKNFVTRGFECVGMWHW